MEQYDGGKNKEFSIWVSELTNDVTEDQFKKTFATRFESYELSKLIQDKEAAAVVGYVRFTESNDQRNALIHMNGFQGLGDKSLRITLVAPKHYFASLIKEENYAPNANMFEYSRPSPWDSQPRVVAGKAKSTDNQNVFDFVGDEDEEEENNIIEYNIPVNVDGLNVEFISRSEEVWDSVEKDRWLYSLDNEDGFVPNFKPMDKKSCSEIPSTTLLE
uniref:tRNA selenocysteine-associated protein 1 n=1 Tax=Lepeophtheirus salmonis TaxID=72036 RepID=A0A0K2UPK5_LEPSM